MNERADVVVRPYGDAALLVDLPDLAAVRALDTALRAAPPTGVEDLVPAARTLLLRLAPGTDTAATRGLVQATWAGLDAAVLTGQERVGTGAEPLVLDVHYDGADLADVAATTGLTVADVVARHTAPVYEVAFGGFMPGFAYLTGLDPVLHVPRRDSPRERVPAGSVAIAGEFTAVYPAATPGGWQLLGRTEVELFDVDRDPPALLAPGTRVRFRAAGARP